MSEKYLLNLVQPNCKTGLLERLFPPLPPIPPIGLASTSGLTRQLPLLPFGHDLFVFSEETIKGYSQLFDFTEELECWLNLIRDRSKNRVRRRVLEEGKEGGIYDCLDEGYNLLI